MLNFPLIPGDKYEGRCAEIYITEKQFLVYHCSICDEIYATFNDLLSHITKDHYENTKEYHEESEATSVETDNILQNHANENQFIKKELKIESHNTAAKNDLNTEMANKATVLAILKNESVSLDQKNTPQRKKPRIVSSILKNYALNRTKTSALTRVNEESKYICSLCGFAFKEKLNLRTHLLRHSNQKSFNCSMCPKKFYTKSELRLHEYRHKAERSYLCKHCGMGFLSNQSLTQHVKNHHSQQNPTKCEQKNQWPTHKEEHILPYRRDSDLETNDQGNKKKSGLNSNYGNHHYCSTALPQKNNKECPTNESKLSIIETSDQYELVQTLTDLECNKNE